MALLRSKIPSLLAPEILADAPPCAEVLVGPATLTVTVSVPQVPAADADVFLTRNTIRIRSRSDPSRHNFVVPLPVSVEPERYVLRSRNGVLDFLIERASR